MTRQYGAAPQPLPGDSAARMALRGMWLGVLAAVCGLGLTVQAYVPWQAAWVALCLVLVALLLGLYVRSLVAVRRREREEEERGYTTMLQVARQKPGLWLLDDRTLRALSAPGETRPPDTRRRTVEAWLAQRERRVR